MPAADADLQDEPLSSEGQVTRLPFPPITKSHILNCSVHSWHPLFRTLTPKTRLILLSDTFIDYLCSDGIILPEERHTNGTSDLSDYSDSDDDEAQRDPSHDWPEVHAAVISTIAELGGKVHPKLNWSAPKDATWMATTNSMECTSANDIYLLLKSSDFVTHDLEQAFDECVPDDEEVKVPYHLVLRKSIPSVVTSMEFRCFVKDREIVGICQRELNHYEFLPSLIPLLQRLIGDFFEEKLRDKFPDPSFVFDVYIPQPKEKARVWLIDINPWAPRTDPLLFSWMELLTNDIQNRADITATDDEDVEDIPRYPEFRVVKRDDPEAYNFNSPLYSAHKLPKEVVDAGLGGRGGIREFLEKWNEIQAQAGAAVSDDDD